MMEVIELKRRMTLQTILYLWYVVEDTTMVYLREGNNIIARGHWYQDNILRYKDHEVLCFTKNNETDTLSVKLRGAD